MFDKSFLPDALFEFVIISDSHYMLDPGDGPLEFENRRKQPVRRGVVLHMAAALSPTFVVHNGDMIQEYPDELQRFRRAIDESLAQMQQSGLAPHYVAGNQDIGDEPDPTMPAPHVSRESLELYHQKYGRSWYSFDQADCHFVLLNSQIMNGSLEEAVEQQAWVERDLADNAKKRIFVFLHLPPYLFDESDPSMGCYDNLANPARSWLLSLVRRYKVEMLFAGHVHFSFLDYVDETRYLILASPVFTRPGFAHLFTGSPPPQRGREDVPKFGFYLMRVRSDNTDVHFIRTYGAEKVTRDDREKSARLITRVSGTLPQSPLGITLSHPLATVAEIPRAWPSVVREKVRNDYPLLSCMEMGVGQVRAPLTDFQDAFQRRRLELLRKGGVKLQAVAILSDEVDVLKEMRKCHTRVDGLELQMAGTLCPSAECIALIKAVQRQFDLRVSVSSIVSREAKSGKQFPRSRLGYTYRELSLLNESLAESDVKIDRAICKLSNDQPLWDQIWEMAQTPPFSHIPHIDFTLEFSSTDDPTNANLAAEAMFAMILMPASCLYVEPLIDFDRTMDVTHGLLDTLCNPRPASQVLQSVNTILYSQPLNMAKSQSCFKQIGDVRVSQITTDSSIYTLLSVQPSEARNKIETGMEDLLEVGEGEELKIYLLAELISRSVSWGEAKSMIPSALLQGPVLIVQARPKN
ncbi:MAG: metallophosphoesterase [Candidatus Poribacteria bacterium]|nr:metallophosphoesterase [Candidatus Poribacteria bacterium]